MKKTLLLLAFLPALMGSTCLHPNGPTPPADGGTITDCSSAALHQAEVSIEGSVANALALGNCTSVTAALASIAANLAATAGAPLAIAEVTCVVQWVVAEAQKQAVTADSLEVTKVTNGKQWLSDHGATVTGTFSP